MRAGRSPADEIAAAAADADTTAEMRTEIAAVHPIRPQRGRQRLNRQRVCGNLQSELRVARRVESLHRSAAADGAADADAEVTAQKTAERLRERIPRS